MTVQTAPWGVTDITDCLTRVLAAIVDVADTLPSAVTLPARQITTSAGATWDCEMLYVAYLRAALGLPEPTGENLALSGLATWPPPPGVLGWQVTVEAGIVRKITAQPGNTTFAPDVAAFTRDLEVVSSDTAVLFDAALTVGARNFQPVPVTVEALFSQGGFHGAAATFTVEPWAGVPGG